LLRGCTARFFLDLRPLPAYHDFGFQARNLIGFFVYGFGKRSSQLINARQLGAEVFNLTRNCLRSAQFWHASMRAARNDFGIAMLIILLALRWHAARSRRAGRARRGQGWTPLQLRLVGI
jgi:hypothetical protein